MCNYNIFLKEAGGHELETETETKESIGGTGGKKGKEKWCGYILISNLIFLN